MKRKGGKTKRGLKKKTSRTGRMRAGGKGKGRGCKERRRGNKGEKAGHSFLQVIPTRAAS